MYHMQLSYRATRVYKLLYATMFNRNPRIQQKVFKEKIEKGLWTYYTANQRQDKRTTLKIKANTGQEPTG